MARYLIAGYGYLGERLGARLIAAGHSVCGLRRQPRESDGRVKLVAADLTRLESLETVPAGIDYVVYMASAGRRDEQAYREAYVDGLQNLTALLERRGETIRRLLFVSSTGVYDDAGGGWVDEQTPARPVAPTAQRLLEGETVATASAWPTTVLRLAGLYGPGRALFVDTIRRGERIEVDEARYVNLIHVEDAAGAILHLTARDDAGERELFLCADDEPVLKAELLRWIARALGRRGLVFEPPAGSSRPNRRCRNARLRESGYRFRFPTFREGYRELV